MAQYAQTAAMGLKGSTGFNPMEEERLKQAQLQRKAEEERQYQQGQNEFAERFGRGLTSGAASTRGQAGQRVNVPPAAMQQPNQTYWNQGNAQSGKGNTVAAQGELARAAQSWQDAGDDKKAQAAAKQALIQSYNDSPFSSVTDAADIQFDKAGNMTFIKADGKPINKKPVSVDDFRRVGEANNLIDQSVFQRTGGMGAGQGQGMGFQSKSAVKAAEVVGGADIKRMGDEIKSLEKQLEITGDDDKPMLIEQINKAKDAQREAIKLAGQNIYGAGLPMQGAGQGYNPQNDLKQLMDIGSDRSDTEIRQAMWDRYGDQGVMRIVENTLNRRAQGMQQPDPKGTKAAGLQKDVPVGPTGQPDLQLDNGGLQSPKEKSPISKGEQRYKQETEIANRKKVRAKESTNRRNKIYDITSRLNPQKQSLRGVKQGSNKPVTEDDAKYLLSVYNSDDPNISKTDKSKAYIAYKRYMDSKNK